MEQLLIKVEPYWNVNTSKKFHKLNNTTIKVEPYWNVNLLKALKNRK